MNLRSIVHATLMLAVSGAALAQTVTTPASGDDEFTVGDIRVEGLQRISEGTVYNYLPVNIGDRFNRQRRTEALKALYATGFFRDIELRRDGGTLIVAVLERPSIESFELKGNKDIKTEDLTKSLKNVGLSAGKTFNQSTLDEVKGYLTDQYYSRGKYSVVIDAKVEELPQQNQVKVTVNVNEGKRARIRQINIVGNHAFDEDDIREKFESKTPHLTSFFKQDDRYARETLQGDLEKIRSFYMDRGYANFSVDSTQVAIAPEKDDIFITVNITEGEVFKIGTVKLAGNLMVDETELRKLIQVQSGMVYSRKLITQSEEAIKLRLGQDGYAFAKVEAVPAMDDARHEVGLTFLVEPGSRVYVHRVNYTGSTSVNDEVFRRETRQLEGGYLSNTLLDRSKQLLQRLPYLEKVEFNTTPVPGTPDMVDVDFKIKEGLPGQFTGGVSYSETYKLGLNASIVHSNFLGTGNRVALEVDSGRYSKVYSFSHTNPYAGIDGISRTLSVAYRDTTQYTSSTSDFSTKTASAGVTYGYPLTEFQSVRWGVSVQQSDLLTSPSASAEQAVEWVRNNGNTYTRNTYSGTPALATAWYGSKFNVYSVNLGWGYDSLNRAIFADRGARHRLNFGYAMPFSDVEFWTANYDGLQLLPLGRAFTLLFNAEVAYSQAMGKTTTVPPYLNSYAGGPTSVRGYRESYLGPRDTYGNPYGGNLRTVLQTEVLLPMPEKWRNSARFSLFYDIGNVFSTENVKFTGLDPAQTPVEYRFGFDKLKHSTGLAVQWLAPLGIFRFSYAVPLNANKSDGVHYKDDKESFQFSVGQAF
ncbi:MAG: outer membrane protein assembly factor BamA [Steroidobacteraceae bacterium]